MGVAGRRAERLVFGRRLRDLHISNRSASTRADCDQISIREIPANPMPIGQVPGCLNVGAYACSTAHVPVGTQRRRRGTHALPIRLVPGIRRSPGMRGTCGGQGHISVIGCVSCRSVERVRNAVRSNVFTIQLQPGVVDLRVEKNVKQIAQNLSERAE